MAENGAARLPPGCPPLDWSRAVDGRRRITVYRELPSSSTGAKWEIRSKICSVYDKGPGKGSVLEKEHVLVNVDTGEVYTRAWESALFVGTGGWGGERGEILFVFPIVKSKFPSDKGNIGPSMKRLPPPTREPNSVAVFQTTAETAHLYR